MGKKELTLVGYWRSKAEPDLPKPKEGKVKKRHKAFVEALSKIEAKAKENHYKGWSNCRICGEKNGSTDFTLGGFKWPEGYAHYIEDHGVDPDPDFAEFVESKTASKKPKSEGGYEDPPEGTFFDVMKKDTGFLRISKGEFEGVERIDIRYFYFDKKKEAFLPTRKGVSIPIEKWGAVTKRVARLLES